MLCPLPRSGRVLALLCCLGALSVPGFAGVARGQEYKIKIHRPEKVGESFTLSVTGDSKTVIAADVPGAPPKREVAFTVRVEGTVKVLEADKTDSATKYALTVEKCLRDDKPLFEKGTVVTAESEDGKTVYSVNGEKVEQSAAEALGVALPAHGMGQKDDDATYGTDEPQKVGGTWPINAEATAENVARSANLPVKKENVKGTGKLAAVKQVDGKEVLQIDLDVNVTDIRGDMPTGGTMDGGSLEFRGSEVVPADANGMALSHDVHLKGKLKIKAQGPNKQEVKVEIDLERNVKMTFGEVK